MFLVQGKFIGDLCKSVRERNKKTIDDISVLCQNKPYAKIKEFEAGDSNDANILIPYLAMMNQEEIIKFYSIISLDEKFKSVFDDRIKYNFLSCIDEKFLRRFFAEKRSKYNIDRVNIALSAGVSDEFLKDFEEDSTLLPNALSIALSYIFMLNKNDFNILLKELIGVDSFVSILNSDYIK